ncbi:MAG: hypothetical protein RLY93_17865 [Sumerlaeia bacterium]
MADPTPAKPEKKPLTPEERAKLQKRGRTMMGIGAVVVICSLLTVILSERGSGLFIVSAVLFLLGWLTWFGGKSLLKFKIG